MSNVLAATQRPAAGLVGVPNATAYRSGGVWTVSWSGVVVFYGGILSVQDQATTTLNDNQILCIDLENGVSPYPVIKTTVTASLDLDILTGRKLLLVGNKAGAIYGAMAATLSAIEYVGSSSIKGDAGWTPVFAVADDGARRVQQVVDWIGGTGPKPATGKYVGSTGLVTDISAAVDVRGPETPIDGMAAATGVAIDSTQLPVAESGGANRKRSLVEVFDLGSVLDRTSVAHAEASTVRAAIKRIRVQYRAPLYAQPGTLVGGGEYLRVASEPSHTGKFRTLDRWSPTGAADPTNGGWWELDTNTPDPKQFGALGDGVAEDSAAITAADAYAAAKGHVLNFSIGAYSVKELTATTGWAMSPDAFLKFIGSNSQRIFTCEANGLVFGDINMDFAGVVAYRGAFISGNKNVFGRVIMKNMTALFTDPNGGTGLYILGNNNAFTSVMVYDFVNVGHSQNDSMPQGITLSGSADGNNFSQCYGYNIRALIVNNSSGRNIFGLVQGANVQDNLFYAVGTDGHSTIDSLLYDGVGASASALGVRHGASCMIGDIIISGTGGVCIFFDGAKRVDIGDIFVRDASSAILSLVVGDPLTPTDTVCIGSIKGTAKNCFPIALQSTNGEVGHLSIGSMDLVVTLDATFGLTNTNSFIRLDAAKGLNIGRCKVEVVLDGYVAVNPFYTQINSALVYKSFIESWQFGVFNSDRTTPLAGFNVLTIGNASSPVTQSKLNLGEGCFTTAGALRYYDWGGVFMNRLVSDGVPTVGYGKQGEVRWAQNPTASLRGWICTATGSPGTWVAF